MFADRERKAERYPFFEWKVRLFAVGAALGVAGIVLETDWIVLVAIAVLVAAFLLRFIPGGAGSSEGEEEDPEG